MNQAQRVLEEAKQAPRRRRTPWEGLAESLETMAGRVGQVVEQARPRIFAGDTTAAGRIVSAFRTAHGNDSQRESEQAHRFGELVRIQEAENQIVTHFEVFAERPADSTLLLPSIEVTNRDWDE